MTVRRVQLLPMSQEHAGSFDYCFLGLGLQECALLGLQGLNFALYLRCRSARLELGEADMDRLQALVWPLFDAHFPAALFDSSGTDAQRSGGLM